MKKLVILSAVLMMVGCAEKKPLTPEEQWHGYCTSIGNAARSIMLDRQNAITKEAAIEHASKLKDQTTKGFVDKIIERVYAYPQNELNNDREALQLKFKQEATEECLNAPHDPKKMPDYKPF
jgi:hypothetical protein